MDQALLAVATVPENRHQNRIDRIRAFVWMHSQCNRWAVFYSVIITLFQCLASYAAGFINVIQDSQLIYLTAGLSFLVGSISTVAKLKFCNFDAVSEQHNTAIVNWNELWSQIEEEINQPQPTPFESQIGKIFAGYESSSESILPLWVRRKCYDVWKNKIELPDMCQDSAVT